MKKSIFVLISSLVIVNSYQHTLIVIYYNFTCAACCVIEIITAESVFSNILKITVLVCLYNLVGGN